MFCQIAHLKWGYLFWWSCFHPLIRSLIVLLQVFYTWLLRLSNSEDSKMVRSSIRRVDQSQECKLYEKDSNDIVCYLFIFILIQSIVGFLKNGPSQVMLVWRCGANGFCRSKIAKIKTWGIVVFSHLPSVSFLLSFRFASSKPSQGQETRMLVSFNKKCRSFHRPPSLYFAKREYKKKA